ncbi:ribbon-helix-helix protein, CopG family [Gemmatimonas sp.]|jgi:predicted transcriptional regulator|uniref:ribbon-helix-helix protein, CopG family n=1 Tax=Gemmatimonas sp. TaxID=1962908 RepID=UPI0037BF2F60
MTKAAKIAITIPPEDLAAADALAAKLGRSRSWVLSEALRRFVTHEQLSHELDASRAAQLRRDLALTAEARIREAERQAAEIDEAAPVRFEEPRRFANYDDFVAWRRARADND